MQKSRFLKISVHARENFVFLVRHDLHGISPELRCPQATMQISSQMFRKYRNYLLYFCCGLSVNNIHIVGLFIRKN